MLLCVYEYNKGGGYMAEIDKIICTSCGKEKKATSPGNRFYQSQSTLYKYYKHIPICKDCIGEIFDSYKSKYKDDKLTMYHLCRLLDLPYSETDYSGAIQNSEKTGWKLYQSYFKQINSFRDLNNIADCFEGSEMLSVQNDSEDDIHIHEEDVELDAFEVTPEMKYRWGENYSNIEVRDLEKFYGDMHRTHTIVTPQHEKALIMICKLQLKMDKSLEADDMGGFSKMHGEYQKLLTSSGLRPIDKVGGAEASGIKSFGQIFEEVEKDGFIKPESIKENQDIVDKTIQYIMNYTKKLLNKQVLTEPPVDTPRVDD